jgi:hypothetical protein
MSFHRRVLLLSIMPTRLERVVRVRRLIWRRITRLLKMVSEGGLVYFIADIGIIFYHS